MVTSIIYNIDMVLIVLYLKSMGEVILHTDYVRDFIDSKVWSQLKDEIVRAHRLIEMRSGPGSEFLGWLDLPYQAGVKEIIHTANRLREDNELLVVVAIGGSMLTARAVIHALLGPLYYQTDGHKVYYAGYNLDSDYHMRLMEFLKDKEFALCVVSKSGSTIEPAVTFRMLRKLLEQKYGKKARNKIVVITDPQRGPLRKLAQTYGYITFSIPPNVGGRFSGLSPAGLFPMAFAGVDIEALLEGARDEAQRTNKLDLDTNHAYLYAGIRNALYRQGKKIEIFVTFAPHLYWLNKFWEQMFAESEGKAGKGLYAATAQFTMDLHSIGQWIQEAERTIFETFFWYKPTSDTTTIPVDQPDIEALNYLHGKPLSYINENAKLGTQQAHKDGGVPNLEISIDTLDPYHLGRFIFFIQKSVAISGHILGVNPFNQPGVEAYKKNMFQLLGR